ncbi:hypothetical protein IFM89_017641 [Coptis chinensis]|uniref:Uncharacterized protein n=1 Tax=Coptis chinensis TaxID=261450 RepID=A0A835GZF9_9MAGN|nr:hypothetical protein IFM89_017641 [Coptis chinensis]
MGDPYLFSPKAPRCASGWRELLGLKKLQQQSSKLESVSKTSSKNQSLKHFRYRNPKSDPSLGLPLLEETDSDRVELPRVSLDSQKSRPSVKRQHNHPPKVRLARRAQDSNNCNNSTTATTTTTTSTISASASAMGVSMDSPRMNSSGKVVFQSLERSSSSPSTFNGGPRIKYKGMERRSYSANVSVTPVLNLNVPVGSLRGSSKFGLGQLFPSHKKGGGGGTSADLSDKMRSGQVSKQKPSS